MCIYARYLQCVMETPKEIRIKQILRESPFVKGFVDALFFTNRCEDDVEKSAQDLLEDTRGLVLVQVKTDFTVYDFSDLALSMLAYDTGVFMHYATSLYWDGIESDLELAGRNFFYTREGHGTGFLEHEDVYGDGADRLTELAHLFASVDPYVGDDGLIYIRDRDPREALGLLRACEEWRDRLTGTKRD